MSEVNITVNAPGGVVDLVTTEVVNEVTVVVSVPGGEGGAVASVNGQTSVVVLDAGDVGALVETLALEGAPVDAGMTVAGSGFYAGPGSMNPVVFGVFRKWYPFNGFPIYATTGSTQFYSYVDDRWSLVDVATDGTWVGAVGNTDPEQELLAVFPASGVPTVSLVGTDGVLGQFAAVDGVVTHQCVQVDPGVVWEEVVPDKLANGTISGTLTFTGMDAGAALAIRDAAGLGTTSEVQFGAITGATGTFSGVISSGEPASGTYGALVLYGSVSGIATLQATPLGGAFTGASGQFSLDLENGGLIDSNSYSVEWVQHKLVNTGAFARGGTYGLSLDWASRQLFDTDGATVVASWGNGNGTFSVNDLYASSTVTGMTGQFQELYNGEYIAIPNVPGTLALTSDITDGVLAGSFTDLTASGTLAVTGGITAQDGSALTLGVGVPGTWLNALGFTAGIDAAGVAIAGKANEAEVNVYLGVYKGFLAAEVTSGAQNVYQDVVSITVPAGSYLLYFGARYTNVSASTARFRLDIAQSSISSQSGGNYVVNATGATITNGTSNTFISDSPSTNISATGQLFVETSAEGTIKIAFANSAAVGTTTARKGCYLVAVKLG